MAEKKPTTTTRLKPERVQQKLKSERVQSQLRPERIQAQLEELPGWKLAGDGRALARTYLFPTIRAAVAFVALVAEIGEAEGYVPDVGLRHLEVTLRVATSTEAGVTELDFDAARVFDLRV
jgi:4a-hydroxytetrahydrobiopterin dehydratase